jgi:hypothetical protein
MKKLMYLIVLVLVVLSYPISSMAEGSRMKRTDNYLHVYSKDGDSKITVSLDKDLISIDFGDVYFLDCYSGYTTDIRFKFDLKKSFGVPLYCSESKIDSLYNFEPYFVEKLIHNLKKYYVLRISIPDTSEVVTFDLIGFTYLYNLNS